MRPGRRAKENASRSEASLVRVRLNWPREASREKEIRRQLGHESFLRTPRIATNTIRRDRDNSRSFSSVKIALEAPLRMMTKR